jgi:hypothetical protein
MKNIIFTTLYILIAIPTLFLITIQFLDIAYPPFVTLNSGEVDMTSGTTNAWIALITSIVVSVVLFVLARKWFKK